MSRMLEPIALRSLNAPNRLVLAPMTTYSSQPDGVIDPEELPYLRRRAAGGLGIVMTAACYVSDAGKAFRGQFGCAHDQFLPSLRSVAEAIHDGGAQAVLQIHHGGRQSPPDIGGCVAPSAIASPRPGAPVPRELTGSEIEQTIDDFAHAARRAQLAGFDGVEIHGANTYLLQQFVSPASNQRSDRWNASDLRFPVELTKAVRRAVGDDFCVGYRFSPEEPEPGGLELRHTFALIDALLECDLDFFHVSLRSFDQPSLHNPASAPVTALLSAHLNGRVPLITVGNIKSRGDLMKAESLGADLVAIGRVAISDPEVGAHLARGSAVRTKVPRDEIESKLTLPAGLAVKVRTVEGWFEIEDGADLVE